VSPPSPVATTRVPPSAPQTSPTPKLGLTSSAQLRAPSGGSLTARQENPSEVAKSSSAASAQPCSVSGNDSCWEDNPPTGTVVAAAEDLGAVVKPHNATGQGQDVCGTARRSGWREGKGSRGARPGTGGGLGRPGDLSRPPNMWGPGGLGRGGEHGNSAAKGFARSTHDGITAWSSPWLQRSLLLGVI
jgi:hypothetical protein